VIYAYKEFIPVIDKSAFVHPTASVIGNVVIGKNVYIGPGASLRGDFGKIVVEDGCNVQDNCILHMFPGKVMTLRENAHIGHGAIIHGANIGRNCLVGMNAVLMDDVELGDECIVGALAFVKAGMLVPNRKLLVGNPAQILKDVTDEMINWKTEGTKLYQELPAEYNATLKEVEPLSKIPAHSSTMDDTYKPLYKSKK
jgi:carbonic anhydrase/acetyltransferase-like protein (isoleucine patch superfamily)